MLVLVESWESVTAGPNRDDPPTLWIICDMLSSMQPLQWTIIIYRGVVVTVAP